MVYRFGLSLTIGNRDLETQQLKSGSTVCLSHGKPRSRWPEWYMEMQALLVPLLCYVWSPIPKITSWSGWLLLTCWSGQILAIEKEKKLYLKTNYKYIYKYKEGKDIHWLFWGEDFWKLPHELLLTDHNILMLLHVTAGRLGDIVFNFLLCLLKT